MAEKTLLGARSILRTKLNRRGGGVGGADRISGLCRTDIAFLAFAP